jgi:hypothetical protein
LAGGVVGAVLDGLNVIGDTDKAMVGATDG